MELNIRDIYNLFTRKRSINFYSFIPIPGKRGFKNFVEPVTQTLFLRVINLIKYDIYTLKCKIIGPCIISVNFKIGIWFYLSFYFQN